MSGDVPSLPICTVNDLVHKQKENFDVEIVLCNKFRSAVFVTQEKASASN